MPRRSEAGAHRGAHLMPSVEVLQGNCMDVLGMLPERAFQTCVTSPPYFGLRDYGAEGQIGREESPDEFVKALVEVFRGVRRVLRDDGTLWLNLGDSYARTGGTELKPSATARAGNTRNTMQANANRKSKAPSGLKDKDLIGIPWRVAFALQEDGWWLRSDIIWQKPNPMPESVNDRPTSSHEHVFLLAKSERYFYDAGAIREDHTEASIARAGRGRSTSHKWADGGPGRQTLATDTAQCLHPAGRNARNVWTISTHPFSGAHFATMPPDLAERCIKAGTSERGCCASCGGPFRRVLGEPVKTGGRSAGNGFVRPERESIGGRGDETVWEPTARATGGWQPSCQCAPSEPVPCAVLDPFGGAGTTGLVANRLRRSVTLIELNPAYADMARHRIASDAPLLVSA